MSHGAVSSSHAHACGLLVASGRGVRFVEIVQDELHHRAFAIHTDQATLGKSMNEPKSFNMDLSPNFWQTNE